ncbi:hypothetical protein OIU77_015477 [Salix suchowensis]|uniref:Glycine-rich protein n=1 Tax=Salix suchowensis TaxID=1278906 RepID=A0ABQ8ZH36_9ROSI|nr:hypothetical protein OIU77_015477 [Salix suchowensis]
MIYLFCKLASSITFARYLENKCELHGLPPSPIPGEVKHDESTNCGAKGTEGSAGINGKLGNGKAGVKLASSWQGGEEAGGGGVIVGGGSGVGSAGGVEPGGVCVS